MASVLIERETIGKNELEALLENKWDEFLANEEAHKDDDADSDEGSEEPVIAEPEEPAVAAEPPMAPGTPPAYNA